MPGSSSAIRIWLTATSRHANLVQSVRSGWINVLAEEPDKGLGAIANVTPSAACAGGPSMREASACIGACTFAYIGGTPDLWQDAGRCWPASCDADLSCTLDTSVSSRGGIQHCQVMVFHID